MRFLQTQIVALSNAFPATTRSLCVAARPVHRALLLHQASVAFRCRQPAFFTTHARLAKDPAAKDDCPSQSSVAAAFSGKDKDSKGGNGSGGGGGGGGGGKKKGRKTTAKKKLHDPLRRVASIAQRANRKPQHATKDGESMPGKDYAQTICAFCVAESFNMKEVVRALHSQHYIIDPDAMAFDEDEIVHARDTRQGDFYIFASGTVVTWSLPPEKGSYVATHLLNQAKERGHDQDLDADSLDSLTEKLEFETDPTTSTHSMRGDTVVLGARQDGGLGSDPSNTGRAKIAFSSGLARSTKVAVLETQLEEFLAATEQYPEQLVSGRLLVDMKAILQRTGEILQLRAQLNFFSELTDSLPDQFWDQKSELNLHSIYDQVGKALDVPSRIRVLNQRMDYADDMLETFRGMLQAKHEVKLEQVIIVLIAIEVLFQFINWWREYKDKSKAASEALSPWGFGVWILSLD